MSTGLKQELGLGDPRPQVQGSTEQADKFKAAYQAAAGPINESLQYTAAHAEQAKHTPHAGKRDTSCQAYQAALSRIDPTNPAVAQSAIDQVLAAVQGLKSAVETFKTAVQKAFDAWTAKEGDLHSITDKIREMVDWGHEKAATLQQVVDGCVAKANQRAYEEALKVLEQLNGKLGPIYEEFLKQKAAKEEYDPALAALQPRLDATKICTFKALVSMQQDLESTADQMQQAASKMDFVTALAQLRTLEGKIGAFEAKLAEIEAKKAEYEAARQALDPKLGEASTCQYKALAEMDQQIADLTTRADAAAAEEDYEQAVTLVGELSTKVDEKVARVKEIEAKKAEYEAARQALDPKLAEASTSQYKALAELDQQIADLTTRTDTAAADEDYEQAVTLVGELTTKVDEKLARAKEIEAKRAEYDAARQALDPKLSEASSSQYKTLAELDQQIADLTAKTDAAAADEDYEQAVTLVGELSTKVEEKLAKIKELEEKKAAYETLAQELSPRLPNQSEADFPSLGELQTELVSTEDQMKAAADAEDYDKALEHANTLKTKLEEYETKKKELEEKKAEYETLAQELSGRMPTQSEADYPSLEPLQTELVSLEDQMKAAADAKDYDKALEHGNTLKTKLEEYETKKKELEEKKAEYEKVAQEVAGRMPTQSEAGYPSLGPLQTELVSLEGQMKASADAKEYDKALEHANNLKTKIDEYETKKKELEAKYQQQLKEAEAQVAKMNSHGQKAHYAAEITAAAGQVAAAKAKGDSGAIEEAITALKPASSACFRVVTAMDMLDKGLVKARAEEVADVSQSLVDSGVDQEKALEVGQIMNKGGAGDVNDSKLVAAQVAKLPTDVIKDMRAKGTKVVACRGNITDHRTDLKGVQPRGWPAGSTWDSVPGVFLGDSNEVVVATRGHGTAGGPEVPKTGDGHGSYDLTAHEAMHGYDHTGSPEKHDDADFKKAWTGDKSKLGPYYTQGGGAGEEEAFAESAARYYGGDPNLKTDWPKLYKYWEEVEKKKKNP